MASAPRPVGDGFRRASFDLAAARNAHDIMLLDVPGSARVIDGVAVREIRFRSFVWDSTGRTRPIRIQGFLAIPPGRYPKHSKPAVILAHGLGWHGTAEEAVETCRNLDAVGLSISAPGLGGSEGDGVTPDKPRPLFAVMPEVRQSWLYAYVYAVLRAITLLQTIPQADPRGIVVSGVSMGGVASLIANGVDDRVRGVMVVSAAGGFEAAARQGSWWRRLLASSGLKPEDRGPQVFFRALDPQAFVGRQHGAVFMVIGAQDEFFPLDRVIATYRAINAPAKTLELVADYDHFWYFSRGCTADCMPGVRERAKHCPQPPKCPSQCPSNARPPYCGPQASYNNQENFVPRWALLLRSLVAQHASHPVRPFGPPPGQPRVQRVSDDVIVQCASDPAPKAVRLAYSDNNGYTFGQTTLSRSADGTYHLGRGLPRQTSLLFAEVEAQDGAVATSIPTLPNDYRAPIRPFGALPDE
jgi:cephalosporin-C deacetylase-like acetyl esterase